MPVTISILIDDVIVALGGFVSPLVNGAAIVRGQQNRVAPPPGQYVLLTERRTVDLETPSSFSSTADQTRTITTPHQIDIQADFYGSSSGDWANTVSSVFRTVYATAQFPANIQPLFCSDAVQGPLVDGEEQYEDRWTLTASLQYNPSVTLAQQSATVLALNVMEDIQ